MTSLKPGEIAPHDGFYIIRGYSVFLRQGQVMPAISPEIPEIETEVTSYLTENSEEQ
ncbi:MAG: hypothetical protein GX052_04290 [Syntrophomonadaceae bacterium]|jgi:hypothetical protein|nr:hypothetical protein [Syntrophomonadaceae bacterium]